MLLLHDALQQRVIIEVPEGKNACKTAQCSKYHGVVKIRRQHLSIVDTGNCEAAFRAGCQPFFVLAGRLLLQPSQRRALPHPFPPAIFVVAGCLLLNYSSLLRKGTKKDFIYQRRNNKTLVQHSTGLFKSSL